MSPKLVPGQIIIASSLFAKIQPGQVYIFTHGGLEKIKRVEKVDKGKVFFVGDNLSKSSDSRHFGWIPISDILARVVWPRVHN